MSRDEKRIVVNLCLHAHLIIRIGFTDFVSFYLQYTNLYNFVFVTKDWDARYMSYFGYTQTIALTVFGIMAGAIMSYTREVKVSRDRGDLSA